MTETNVIIDGRNFAIQCDTGQEARVQELGRYVDSRIRELKGSGAGTSQSSQLMVLASLVLADEIYELRQQLEQAKYAINQPPAGPPVRETPKPIVYQGLEPAQEKELSEKITKLASRVDTLAKRVKNA